MADRLTPQQRSELMRRVRGKDTAPEMIVRRMALQHRVFHWDGYPGIRPATAPDMRGFSPPATARVRQLRGGFFCEGKRGSLSMRRAVRALKPALAAAASWFWCREREVM